MWNHGTHSSRIQRVQLSLKIGNPYSYRTANRTDPHSVRSVIRYDTGRTSDVQKLEPIPYSLVDRPAIPYSVSYGAGVQYGCWYLTVLVQVNNAFRATSRLSRTFHSIPSRVILLVLLKRILRRQRFPRRLSLTCLGASSNQNRPNPGHPCVVASLALSVLRLRCYRCRVVLFESAAAHRKRQTVSRIV